MDSIKQKLYALSQSGALSEQLAIIEQLIYCMTNTPAMPLPLRHAHFGGFFYVRRTPV
jgi:hypothetical protein